MRKMKLKLFINKNRNKVLYAETGKDFVDQLFHTFEQPLGQAMEDVFDGFISGALATLHTSFAEDLMGDYLLKGNTTKASFLHPTNKHMDNNYCMCDFFYDPKCLICEKTLEARSSRFAEVGDGHVKAGITYLIMDDLTVKPLSSTAVSIMLLNQLPINDLGCIKETEITILPDDITRLLKASLSSKTVLTDIFLPLKESK